MKKTSSVLIAYTLLLLVGGLIGYFTANSLPSLIASSLFSVCLLIAVWGCQQEKSWGYPLAITALSLLILFFGVRLYATQKFMPAGLMFIVSLITLTTTYFLERNKIPLQN